MVILGRGQLRTDEQLVVVATLAGMKWCVDPYSPHQRKNLAVV